MLRPENPAALAVSSSWHREPPPGVRAVANTKPAETAGNTGKPLRNRS